MQTNSWTLISKDGGKVIDELHISGADVSEAAAACQIDYQRLCGGRQEGLHLLSIDNGTIRVSIIPERGMGLWKAWSGEVELGWQSPIDGPVHPHWVPLDEPSGLGWLDGFDELLVRCGIHSNGAPEHDNQGRLLHPLHGKIAQSPAHQLEVVLDQESGEIVVRGIVDEKRFLFYHLQLAVTVRLHPDRPVISIRDEITNLSSVPTGMQLLYHINFGLPLLTPDGELVLPVKQVAPRDLEAAKDGQQWATYGPVTPAYKERVHFFELLADAENQTHVLLKNAAANCGISLCYDITQLPCFSQWKHTGALEDGYVTGLEPATNFPNPRSFEADRGRVVSLAGGESRQFDLQLHYHSCPESVRAAERAIEVLSAGANPLLHPQPKPEWSFGGNG
ncbi:MAG: aldose 1-epimerase family protein [Pirellulales bacterium]|jgi:hypothetical protein|nr:aldose 1-epimerase family protein [Pirellulales bacterium]